MKLFIWENVLTDWTSGMAVAYAETLEDAFKHFDKCVSGQLGEPTKVIDCSTDKTPFTAHVYGGG